MPPTMKWDAEADAKLFGLFLNAFDIKISKEMIKRMNVAMGLDPNSQAITHRIGGVRKRAADLFDVAGGAPTKPIPLTPRGPMMKSGGGSRSRGGSTKAKKNAVKNEPEDTDDDSEMGSPTRGIAKRARSARAAAGKKRTYKESDTEEDEEELDGGEGAAAASKKMKIKKSEENGGGEENGQYGGDEVAEEISFFDGDGGLNEVDVALPEAV